MTNLNTKNEIFSDEALDDVSGGFSFASFFGFPSLPSVPHAPTAKSLASNVTNYVVSHSPIGAIGHALKFW
jgi:hypothetical protein